MKGEVETFKNVNTGKNDTAYKICGVADFTEKATEVLIKQGIAFEDDFSYKSSFGEMSNITLRMVFTNYVDQAATFAAWQVKMKDPFYINRYPAARFVRSPGAIIKRLRHVEAEGTVRRWDDFAFWTFQNGNDIGGFDVPWGPYGFDSYMYQEPVSRTEAERLGLVQKGEVLQVPDVTRFGVSLGKQFNHGVDAYLDDVTPEIRAKAQRAIVERFGPGAIGTDGKPTLDALKKVRAMIGETYSNKSNG